MIKKILTYGIIALLGAVICLSYALDQSYKDKKRYQSNQQALMDKVEYYKTESGRNAASVQALTLTNKELKENYDNVVRAAKDMDISLKRAKSVSTTATETRLQVKTVVRDSIVLRDSIIQKTRMFLWKDPWCSIFGEINKDSVALDVQSVDTLVQIVHKVPHKFWFIKWGCKAIRQEIMSTNPHTKIVYSEYIELKK